MENNVVLILKYGSESKFLTLNWSSTYAQFVDNVLGKWSILSGDMFSATCEVGSISNVALDSDEDLHNLLIVCELTDVRMVNVNICAKIVVSSNESSAPKIPDRSCTPSKSVSPVRASQSHNSLPCEIPALTLTSEAVAGSLQMNPSLSGSSNSVKSKPPFQFLDYGGHANLPTYEMCPFLKERPLLSDCWKEIMNGGIGTVFRGGAVEFRTELIKYTSRLGFAFKYKRNTKQYVTAICNEPSETACGWFIKARRQSVTDFFEIMDADFDHNCVGRLTGTSDKHLGMRIISDLLLDTVKKNPSANGKEVKEQMKFMYGYEVPYWKAHRAAEAARQHIFGDFDESYDQLRWYCEAITRTNPGSLVTLETNPKTHEFERVFIAYKACLDGFKSCRPMLFVDGTFMKGRAKGTLLAATAKDGNNGLFPVAIVVVSAENSDNWEWFLSMIRDNISHDKQICYISDRNLGLMHAFKSVFPNPVHFYCLFHLQKNLQGMISKKSSITHRELLVAQFTDCAYAPNTRVFDDKLAVFKQTGGKTAVQFLTDLPPEKWAVAHSPLIARYGEMTSNAAESFNAWIKEARELPITHMIDDIRCDISRWFVERREDSDSWTDLLVPRKNSLWHYLADLSRTWYVVTCPSGDFQVSSSPSVRVDLSTRTCSCHQWKLTRFPCAHAIAVVCRKGFDVSTVVDECFLTKTYKECYRSHINPIPETEKFEYTGQFGQQKILKPQLNRPIGRPPKSENARIENLDGSIRGVVITIHIVPFDRYSQQSS